jgi:hypothetical protein
MVEIKIQSIDLICEHISVLFEQYWFQEDIVNIQKLLLKKIPEHTIKEFTRGADRENIRFLWLGAEFILNFDYYSQSCWFSSQDEISTIKIPLLYNLLMTNTFKKS